MADSPLRSSPAQLVHPKMFKVLVMDGITEAGLAPLRKQADVEITVVTGVQPEDKLCQLVADKHALLVRSATKVTKAIFDAGKQLLVVGRAGVGVDNIDIAAATEAGVFVVNSPLGNVVAAAEHTVAMIFAAMRRIPEAHLSLARDKKWDRSRYVGVELKGKTLGVVGCGQVGSRVVRILKGAGMNVLVFDPYMNSARAELLQIEKVEDLEEVFARSDVVTLHLPKTPETINLVDKEMLYKMKKGSVIINVARGGILKEDDCVEVLLEGHLRCAAIDVYSKEPIEATNPFLMKADELGPRLILTPHLGASTEEAQLQVAVEVAEQCVDVFAGKVPSWAVNKCKNINLNQGYELDELANLTDAAEFLGHMTAQLMRAPVDSLNCTVEGDHFLKMTTPQTLATYAAVGFLKSKADVGRVNIVNVEQLCASRCLELTHQGIPHQRHSEFRVAVTSSNGQRIEIRATVSARLPNDVIIRAFCGVPCHMKLSMAHKGRLVYSLHNDVPGVLASICQSLAAKDINIADCHLARLSREDQKKIDTPSYSPGRRGHTNEVKEAAICLVLIDEDPENRQEDLFSGMETMSKQFIHYGAVELRMA